MSDFPDLGPTPQDRINRALAVAKKYGGCNDAVDQMVRALLGCPATYLGHYIANEAYVDWKNK